MTIVDDPACLPAYPLCLRRHFPRYIVLPFLAQLCIRDPAFLGLCSHVQYSTVRGLPLTLWVGSRHFLDGLAIWHRYSRYTHHVFDLTSAADTRDLLRVGIQG